MSRNSLPVQNLLPHVTASVNCQETTNTIHIIFSLAINKTLQELLKQATQAQQTKKK